MPNRAISFGLVWLRGSLDESPRARKREISLLGVGDFPHNSDRGSLAQQHWPRKDCALAAAQLDAERASVRRHLGGIDREDVVAGDRPGEKVGGETGEHIRLG